MKTEAQFNLLARAYRKEVRWRGILLFPIVVIAATSCLELGGLFERFTNDHSGLTFMGASLAFLAIFGLNSYFIKSKEGLARKLDLICPNCSHVLRPDDFNMSATTDKCPWCRSRFFF
jgi:hypothetical protein